jgi:thiol-disulfide isomerase/thioredoxin
MLARSLALFGLGLALAGCRAQPVSLKVIDEKGLAEVLREHRGRPVLVDMWATWCGPCVESFPETVAFARRYGDRGLVVVSLSFDDPDNEADVREFLEQHQAQFENFISRYGGSTRSAEAFEIEGTLPAIKIFDREGKLHASFHGDFTADAVRRAVEEVLGDGGG